WVSTGAEGARVQLLPGIYDVLVAPTASTHLPRRLYRGVHVELPSVAGEEVRIELPIVQSELGERLVAVRGLLELSYLDEPTAIVGKNIRISARTIDGAFQSQPYVTCVDDTVCNGSFELFLPPQ